MKLNSKAVKFGIVVHCNTIDKALVLLNLADKEGLKWCNGSKYTTEHLWNVYKENTCYNLNTGRYGDINKLEDMQVIEFEQAVKSA